LATKIFVGEQQEDTRADMAARPIHVLTLTPFYPFADDDASGCFIAEPLPRLAAHQVHSSVIAVQPFYRRRPRPNPAASPAKWCSFLSLPGSKGLPHAGTLLSWSLVSHVRDLHRHRKIDLIHAHSALPCGHAAMRLSRDLSIPFVISVHGLDAFSTRQVSGRAGERCHEISDQVYRAARCVLCVSEHVREQVLLGATGQVNAELVFNGVDPDVFFPGAAANNPDQPTVLSVGDVIPTKGQELVLRAVARLKAQFPQVQYEIIGDGPHLLSLQKLARSLNIQGRVHFRGRRSRREVAEAMRNCAVFALPSRYEGLGCAYLEAMSCARPVIACRGQGIEEIIRHRENGWLVDGIRVDEMTEALTCLLSNPEARAQIGRSARRTIVNNLTLSHQAERLNRVYRGCLA
jgi:teichuronic acid biosynthesis glycosyltransferase TuaC